jgi:membrane protease YdiL (CAAX protease family)
VSDVPLAPPPIGQQPHSTEPPRHLRPWWGLGDVLLSVPFIVVVALIGGIAGLPFVDDLNELAEDSAELPMVILVPSLLAQQLGQGVWPFVVSKWKGMGPVADWHLRFAPTDLLAGIGTAMITIGLAAAAATITSNLVGLADEAEADNTQFLRDAEGTLWIYPLLAAVILGAPLAEELFFRGLILRAFEKRAGPVAAVVGSTVLFTLPHFVGSGLAGTVVLFASIGVVGAVLATVTVVVGRLWPAVIAHMLFNALGAAGALGAFDQFTST